MIATINRKQKKIIILAHEFPPIAGGHVMRALKFAKFLPENGWDPVVVTANPDDCYYQDAWSRDPELLKQLSSAAKVVSVPSPREKMVKVYANRLRGSQQKDANPKSKTDPGKFKLNVSGIIRLLKSVYVWQDQVILWLPEAYKAVRVLIKEEEPQAILTTTPPHLLQLLGLVLKRKTRLYWIADFRDGWVDNFLFQGQSRLRRWIDERIESQVIKDADAVMVVTDHIRKSLQLRYPKYAQKIYLIHNGFDRSDFENLNVFPTRSSNCVHYDYVGNWGGFRDPAPLFKAFEELFNEGSLLKDEVSLTFTGGYHDKDSTLPDWVTVNPPVPHKAALGIMTTSSVLILLASISEREGAFTSKIFEYLAAQRPILALIPQTGELAELLIDYSLGFIASPMDIQQIKKAVIDSFEAAKRKQQPNQNDIELLQQFDRRSQTLQLTRILDASCST